MALRKVKIPGRGLQVSMTEQDLNRAQIGATFQ
jgi:hypothetical protein